ncbi:MAG: class II fructose-bisphosphatase [Magnetospirillum sp. WYHS-4]
MTTVYAVERNLTLEAVRVTEAAALAAAAHMGMGDERAADQGALSAIQETLKSLNIDGTVRIGPGGDDTALPLHVGEKLGTGRGPAVDVALMPLEGTSITARGGSDALSLFALAEDGGFLHVPDIYMDKIAVGRGLPAGTIDLDDEPGANLRRLAETKNVDVDELVVCILDRPRHGKLIGQVRESGARIMLISDGDVSGAVATLLPGSGVDVYMGIGGARQGVLTAAALVSGGGCMQARLVVRSEEDRRKLHACGIFDADRKYGASEMAWGEITFAATGVTRGTMLSGVRFLHGHAVTHSLVMRSTTGTLRYVEAHHNFGHQG